MMVTGQSETSSHSWAAFGPLGQGELETDVERMDSVPNPDQSYLEDGAERLARMRAYEERRAPEAATRLAGAATHLAALSGIGYVRDRLEDDGAPVTVRPTVRRSLRRAVLLPGRFWKLNFRAKWPRSICAGSRTQATAKAMVPSRGVGNRDRRWGNLSVASGHGKVPSPSWNGHPATAALLIWAASLQRPSLRRSERGGDEWRSSQSSK